VNGKAKDKPTIFDANKGVIREETQADRDRAEERRRRRENRGAVDGADWRDADLAKLSRAIVAVTSWGYAIRLGYTRDGGAFAVGIIGDGEPFTKFIRPTEGIDEFLDTLIRDYARE
jgi:hypothetical protein